MSKGSLKSRPVSNSLSPANIGRGSSFPRSLAFFSACFTRFFSSVSLGSKYLSCPAYKPWESQRLGLYTSNGFWTVDSVSWVGFLEAKALSETRLFFAEVSLEPEGGAGGASTLCTIFRGLKLALRSLTSLDLFPRTGEALFTSTPTFFTLRREDRLTAFSLSNLIFSSNPCSLFSLLDLTFSSRSLDVPCLGAPNSACRLAIGSGSNALHAPP